MTFPIRLEDWTPDVIEVLLTQGYYESEQFDFKEMLPDSRNDLEKWRLRKSCCAFANSAGGFLIFGVKDNKSLPAANRIIGVDPHIDFFEHFGDFPGKCTPSIDWDFLRPSLPLPNGRVLQVVQIPRSWQAPHWLADLKNEGKHFIKRTNKGNESLSYEAVKMAYLQFYEKRLKLQLLRAELETIGQTAKTFHIASRPSALAYDTGELGVAVIETVLAEVYTILARNPALLADLGIIRQQCRRITAKTARHYQAFGSLSPEDPRRENAIVEHNIFINLWSQELESGCRQAIRALDEIIKE